MSEPHLIFDRDLVRRRRNRMAARARDCDFLLHRVADDFAERLSLIKRTFPVALDVGAHHGVITRRIAALASVGSVVSMDLSEALVGGLPQGLRLVASEEALPFAEGSLDLVFSGLSLQLVNDLPGALIQMRRALRPDGLLLASLLGGSTLMELRQAFLEAEAEERGGVSPRVAPFPDVRDMGRLLQRAGFALPVTDTDVVTVTYASPLALMTEVKAMGASNMLLDRSRVPMTRQLLSRASEIYARKFGTASGRVSATFEIITATAWAPDDTQPKPLKPGSAQVRLADALKATEHKLR